MSNKEVPIPNRNDGMVGGEEENKITICEEFFQTHYSSTPLFQLRSGANLNLMPAQLLVDHWSLFEKERLSGPILDLACGDGHNGIFVATKDLQVICCDISEQALSRAEKLASENRVKVGLWQVDLEAEEANPLKEGFYGGILVFRYLHRPLIPCIKKALKKGGILIYETFTIDQPKFGKPHNPKFLLKPGELLDWFEDWEIFYDFEGVKQGPERAVAQVVCRKPGKT